MIDLGEFYRSWLNMTELDELYHKLLDIIDFDK